MAITKFTPQQVPFEASPNLRAFLEDQMRSIAPLLNDAAQRSEDETIFGDWEFTGGLVIPESAVTAHQAALSIAETQIPDGSILARVAANETIQGAWTFNQGIALNNKNLTGVGSVHINDPGGSEGILWLGGNRWRIVESPDDISNAQGDLQFIQRTTRRMTLRTNGELNLPGNMVIGGNLNIPAGPIASGSYIPAVTGVTNTSGTTTFAAQFLRVGNVVTVSGRFNVNVTTGGLNTEANVSLPIASDFTTLQQGCGVVGSNSPGQTVVGGFFSLLARNKVQVRFTPSSSGNHGLSFTFTYQVL